MYFLSSSCFRTLFGLPLSPSMSGFESKSHSLSNTDNSAAAADTYTSDSDNPSELFHLWKASRQVAQPDTCCERASLQNQSGFQRKCSVENMWLALRILQSTLGDSTSLFLSVDAVRTSFLFFLMVVRGFLPAFRGYSQALILDELQAVLAKGDFTSNSAGIVRLGKLILRECGRMVAESFFDAIAQHNESIVHSSLRYLVEQRQLEQRLRLDIPTLANPDIRDLLHESDLFVRSFTGLGYGFGLFSPLDLLQVMSSFTELITQFFMLYSASKIAIPLWDSGTANGTGPLASHLPLLSVVAFPMLLSFFVALLPRISSFLPTQYTPSEALYSPSEARDAERAERMRSMANGEHYRAEIQVFGLSDWILSSWSASRRKTLGLETSSSALSPKMGVSACIRWLAMQPNVSEMLVLVQNLPLFIYSSTTSLGSLALFRSSLHSLLYTCRALATSLERAFQSIFLMGAFFAAMSVEPHLNPSAEEEVKYKSSGRGMKIEAKNLSYTYPGSSCPTLRNVTFSLDAGETLAIVGYNGAGKSTLANILLRLVDFESSQSGQPAQLLINGTDICRFSPQDYHRHITALFQSFSKLNASVRENVGIGNLKSAFRDKPIHRATESAGADRLVNALPCGIDTNLDCMGSGMGSTSMAESPFFSIDSYGARQGLSGGEWQRVAISRTFMRAHDADLLLLDEPTSHLDAHAQRNLLQNVDKISRDPITGEKTKTVIIITHQLSIARRADKIAMFANGTITEFGSHEDLMKNPDSNYASLFQATMC